MSGMLEPFVVEFVPEAARIELDRLLSAYSLAEKGRRDGTPENTALIEDDPVAVLRSEYEGVPCRVGHPDYGSAAVSRRTADGEAAHPPRSAEQADEETVRGRPARWPEPGAAEDDIVFAALVDRCSSRGRRLTWVGERHPAGDVQRHQRSRVEREHWGGG